MKKISMLAMLALLLVGMVSATTSSSLSFYQNDGVSTINTYAQVEGDYWPWPDVPIPETPTADVTTRLSNEGEFGFRQTVTQYGNGLQWPDGTDHEWSMYETQAAYGSGMTSYSKSFDVWTVHDGWDTEYQGSGFVDVPEGYDSYSFAGVVTGVGPNEGTSFVHNLNTDSEFEMGSNIFVNPWN